MSLNPSHCISGSIVELDAYLLNHLINLLLPHKQDRGRKNALEEFIPDTLIDPSNTLVLYDGENTIQRGLVLGVTGLKPALYNTGIHGENSYTFKSTRRDLHVRVCRPSCNCEGSVKILGLAWGTSLTKFRECPEEEKV